MDNYDDFTQKLYSSIKNQFVMISDDLNYHSKLPSEIDYIKLDIDTNDYGHPINWLLYGKTGIHGFIIGVITEEDQVFDDMSDNNYYPPIITQTLSSISPEYSYSQLAIVLVKENISADVDAWLKNWKDDNRYFRKVVLDISKSMNVQMISEKVVNSCFNPWYSIKLTNDDDEVANLFKDEEDEY